MAATIQTPDFVVRHICDHGGSLGILAEEILAYVVAALGFEILVFAVNTFFHYAPQQALAVFCQQRIPARTPDDLENIPAGTAKCCLEFLDNFAVAAYRSVQALQIAIDDENKIVEPFAYRHCDGAHGLRLVHFTIAQETPDLAIAWLRPFRDVPGSA